MTNESRLTLFGKERTRISSLCRRHFFDVQLQMPHITKLIARTFVNFHLENCVCRFLGYNCSRTSLISKPMGNPCDQVYIVDTQGLEKKNARYM